MHLRNKTIPTGGVNHHNLILNPHLARQFLEPIFASYFKEAPRQAYIDVRGKRESDEKITFRRFYLGIDPLIEDMNHWQTDHHYWFGVAPRWSDQQGKKKHCLVLTALFQDNE